MSVDNLSRARAQGFRASQFHKLHPSINQEKVWKRLPVAAVDEQENNEQAGTATFLDMGA